MVRVNKKWNLRERKSLTHVYECWWFGRKNIQLLVERCRLSQYMKFEPIGFHMKQQIRLEAFGKSGICGIGEAHSNLAQWMPSATGASSLAFFLMCQRQTGRDASLIARFIRVQSATGASSLAFCRC